MKRIYLISAYHKDSNEWVVQTQLQPSLSLVEAKKRLASQQKKVAGYEFRICSYIYEEFFFIIQLVEVISTKLVLKRLWIEVKTFGSSNYFGFILRTKKDSNGWYPGFLVKLGEKL